MHLILVEGIIRSEMAYYYITSTKGILGGEPVIAGTRIPVARVRFLVEEKGYTPQRLRKEYGHVSSSKMRGALRELGLAGA